jgi:poly(A) polymerase
MFFDPIEKKVIDYVGGQEDLNNRVLRAIGEPNHRFEEDHLRLLRAVRFAARFQLTIDALTADAIRRHADQLKRITPERIAEELRLMLTPQTRVQAHRMLCDFGLLSIVLRLLPDAQPPVGIFAAIDEPTISFGLSLAAIVLDARGGELQTTTKIREASAAMRQALKISNDESDMMEGALAFGLQLQDTPPSVATLKRFLATPTAPVARSLMHALARVGILSARIENVLQTLTELEKTEYAPTPFVTGDDLTAAGLKPGPLFKKVLDAVYDAQLEARVTNKVAALDLALILAKQ